MSSIGIKVLQVIAICFLCGRNVVGTPFWCCVSTAELEFTMLKDERSKLMTSKKQNCTSGLVARRSGNAFHPINEVTLRRARLVL